MHLRCLIAASERRSFRRAAVALNVTQSAWSKCIHGRENWLGVPLFERSTSGAHLTSDGDYFALGAKRIVSGLLDIENRARAGDADRLQLGFYTSLSTGLLGDVVCKLAERHDKVDVAIGFATRKSCWQPRWIIASASRSETSRNLRRAWRHIASNRSAGSRLDQSSRGGNRQNQKSSSQLVEFFTRRVTKSLTRSEGRKV